MATGLTAANSLASAVRAFEQNRSALADIAARLTSGQRILSIGDDSASVSVAAGLRAQLATTRSAQRNAAEGSSLVEVAQAGLDQIGAALTQLSELATQAADVSLLAPERALLAAQFDALRSSIDTVASDTNFNGTALLDGSFSITVDLGEGSDGAVAVAFDDSSSAALFGGASPSLATATDAANAVDAVADAQARFDLVNGTARGAEQQLSQAAEAITRAQGGVRSADAALTQADRQAELARQAATQLRQNTTSNVIAQTQQLNSDLLALVTTPIAPLPATSPAGADTTDAASGTEAGDTTSNSDRSTATSTASTASTSNSGGEDT